MTVYPQEYKLNCVKIGHYGYNIRMSVDSTALNNYTNCDDRYYNCPGILLISYSNTVRYTVYITWDGMTVSSGSISQPTTGDQMYQCVLDNPGSVIRRLALIIKGNECHSHAVILQIIIYSSLSISASNCSPFSY